MSQETVSHILQTREQAKLAGHDYAAYHARRYDYVIAQCVAHRPSPDTTVLDIGRSPLTLKLCQHYRNVTSLGFPLTADELEAQATSKSGSESSLRHIDFDLNDTRTTTRYDGADRFDLIVFGETIEHLVTPPEFVLGYLKTLLAPGGIIICQTPNAVALHKRLKMLFGFNPYERLRAEIFNPGHIREYTKQELMEIGSTVGLRMIEHEYRDYFGVQGGPARRAGIAISRAVSVAIPSLSRGQTIIFGLAP